MSQPTHSIPNPKTSNPARKPRVSIAIATAFGLGYLPKAPGTWGSLGGIIIATSPSWILEVLIPRMWPLRAIGSHFDPQVVQTCFVFFVAVVGLWSAHRASAYWGLKDPQKIVIDEVSGQQIALILGGMWDWAHKFHAVVPRTDFYMMEVVLPNWKYLLLGFILFRVFDIWKPFPARQAESLPGGWGIMADDWIAGIYAALGLWIARAAGL
jgi:phosphatidylglycerophosphatase A